MEKLIDRIVKEEIDRVLREAIEIPLYGEKVSMYNNDKTINLRYKNGSFVPVSTKDKRMLGLFTNKGYIEEDNLDIVSPKIVRNGFKLKIDGYNAKPTNTFDPNPRKARPIGKPVKNPCPDCRLKGVCDNDNCGRRR